MEINGWARLVWVASCIGIRAQSYSIYLPGMHILLTIFLFIFIPIAMLILRLARPRFSIQGFLAALAVITGLPMAFLARSDIPRTISLLHWAPETLFPISPALQIDHTSWYLALALASLSLSIVITSIAHLGMTPLPDLQSAPAISNIIEENHSAQEKRTQNTPDSLTAPGSFSNQQLWAVVLLLTSFSLFAVMAQNLLTLLLAWAALDILELLILLNQTLLSKLRERAVLVFSAKLAGVVTLLLAGLVLGSYGDDLTSNIISQPVRVILVIAAGIRLGVLPLQLPFTHGLPMNRHLGTALRLIPAASSYILLIRVSNTGITGRTGPYLVGLAVLAGIFSAFKWLTAKDELVGRPYWLLGSGSLIVATAILNLPAACLAWSIASLLSGGLIFSLTLRHHNLLPLLVLGAINLSTLPFSPTWQGTTLYQYSPIPGTNLTLFTVFSLFFLFTQAFLLAGFIRHSLRELYPVRMEKTIQVERWVWLLYPLGLVPIIFIHLYLGWLLVPNIHNLPISAWIIGPVTLLISAFSLLFYWRYSQYFPAADRSSRLALWNNLLSLEWFYRILWKLFRLVANIFNLFSTALEGDGGILWALVLFALIFVFLQR